MGAMWEIHSANRKTNMIDKHEIIVVNHTLFVRITTIPLQGGNYLENYVKKENLRNDAERGEKHNEYSMFGYGGRSGA